MGVTDKISLLVKCVIIMHIPIIIHILPVTFSTKSHEITLITWNLSGGTYY